MTEHPTQFKEDSPAVQAHYCQGDSTDISTEHYH